MDSSKVLRKRILLVDDQTEVRETIKMLLEFDEHVVVEAANGPEALDQFTGDRFDLVITDYAMPGMRGDELAKVIKRKSPSQPILLVTGSGGLSSTTADHSDAILNKPFMLEDLRRSVAEALCASCV
jgi:two-component system, cell cycle sensor histidine kinase and response regulator CckA